MGFISTVVLFSRRPRPLSLLFRVFRSSTFLRFYFLIAARFLKYSIIPILCAGE